MLEQLRRLPTFLHDNGELVVGRDGVYAALTLHFHNHHSNQPRTAQYHDQSEFTTFSPLHHCWVEPSWKAPRLHLLLPYFQFYPPLGNPSRHLAGGFPSHPHPNTILAINFTGVLMTTMFVRRAIMGKFAEITVHGKEESKHKNDRYAAQCALDLEKGIANSRQKSTFPGERLTCPMYVLHQMV